MAKEEPLEELIVCGEDENIYMVPYKNHQYILLEYVRKNDGPSIRKLLESNEDLKCKIYCHPINKPILYIACYDLSDTTDYFTVQSLILSGCDLHYSNDALEGQQALHLATLGQNPNILHAVISAENNINVTTYFGETALQILIKSAIKKEHFLLCAERLIEAKININIPDNEGKPPIYWAIQKGHTDIVQLLIQSDDLDLSYSDDEQTSLLEAIEAMGIKKITNTDNTNIPELPEYYNESLMNCLYIGNETEFISLAGKYKLEKHTNFPYTFLQIAVINNLHEVVSFLLQTGSDNNEITEFCEQTPLQLAIHNDNFKVFNLLINDPRTIVNGDVLYTLLYCYIYNISEYLLCLKKLGHTIINRNHVNFCKFGYFTLHIAMRERNSEIISFLLQHRASLANKDINGILTITGIDFQTLNRHFDSCLHYNYYIGKEILISLDFETLLPTKRRKENKDKSTFLTPETEALLYISQSLKLQPLLKHPLLVSFLYLKWYKIRLFFFTSFFIQFVFSAVLFLDISADDMDHSILSVLTTLLLFRALFQISMKWRQYLTRIENCIEISLITVAFLIIFHQLNAEINDCMRVVVLLLSAFQMLFLLGMHSGMCIYVLMLRKVFQNFFKFFLFYFILIAAFAWSFYKLFNKSSYTNIIDNNKNNFTEPKSVASDNNQTNNSDSDADFFKNWFLAVFKTIIMLSGEFEAASIKFDEHYPIFSHLIFLVFVLFVPIVLVNLLNGLAISDIQEIKKEAELVELIHRTERMAKLEQLFFTLKEIFSPFSNLADIFIKRISLFPNALSEYRMHFMENRHIISKSRLQLDGKIIKATIDYIQTKNKIEIN